MNGIFHLLYAIIKVIAGNILFKMSPEILYDVKMRWICRWNTNLSGVKFTKIMLASRQSESGGTTANYVNLTIFFKNHLDEREKRH